ncbi:MAG TPA: glycogen-binding domain-containing protein [Spirochaetia bacterium]|nr:glycogen-binding domain-containing protein [Spirochaetia bacterium]
MISRKHGLLLLQILFLATSGWAQQTWNLDLHLEVSGLKAAAAPKLFMGNLILSYQNPRGALHTSIRYVGAAFRNENFAKIHTFQLNENGVYFLVYPLPKDAVKIEYRLVVDGLWFADPRNPESVVIPDSNTTLSVATIPQQAATPDFSPHVLPGNMVQFYYDGAPGKNVYVAGSFNNWDPFMHRMEETSPGHYALTIRVMPGTYYYNFVEDGRSRPDPENTESVFSRDGSMVSVFRVSKS